MTDSASPETSLPRQRPTPIAVAKPRPDSWPAHEPEPAPLSRGAAEALHALARLIVDDVTFTAWQEPAQLAARRLGCAADAMAEIRRPLTLLRFAALAHRLAGAAATDAATVRGTGPARAATWAQLDLGGTCRGPVPVDALVELDPDDDGAPLLLHLGRDTTAWGVVGYARPHDAAAAADRLDALLRDAAGDLLGDGPADGDRGLLAGAHLRVDVGTDGVWVSLDEAPDDPLDGLVLPGGLWPDLAANVLPGDDRRQLLADAGLAAARHVLLHGRRGAGTSALVQVLRARFPGTVIGVGPDAVTEGLHWLYDDLGDLGPALVVLDDLDHTVSDRRRTSSGEHVLAALATAPDNVVTVAVVHDLAALDDAGKRLFHRRIEVPALDTAAREDLLGRLLAAAGVDVDDLDAVVRATDGATPRDLRELVRLALLRHGADVTGEDLVELSAKAVNKTASTGAYL